MGRPLTHGSKVAGGSNQAMAKVVLPDPVDDDPCCQGIGWVNNSLGQFQSATALGKGGWVVPGNHPQKLAGYLFSGLDRVTPDGNWNIFSPSLH